VTSVWVNGSRSTRRYGQTGLVSPDAALSSGVLGNFTDYLSGLSVPYEQALAYGAVLTDAEVEQVLGRLASDGGVARPTPTRLLIFDGDSLTVGVYAYPGYTDQCLMSVGGTFRAHNTAVAGQLVSAMRSNAAGRVDVLYDASVPLRAVVIWGGTNDLATGVAAATAYEDLRQYCLDRRAVGWEVVVATMLPRSFAGDDADTETERSAFNALIRANWSSFADALADVAADTRIGDAGDENDTTYYDADKAHMTTAGYAVVAEVVAAALATL
jgi:lysophospholipase L1-like esterase